jgi:hypothetical protein
MLKMVVNNEYLTFDCDKKVMDYLCKHYKVSNKLARIMSKEEIANKLESLWEKHVITLENDKIFKYKVKAK